MNCRKYLEKHRKNRFWKQHRYLQSWLKWADRNDSSWQWVSWAKQWYWSLRMNQTSKVQKIEWILWFPSIQNCPNRPNQKWPKTKSELFPKGYEGAKNIIIDIKIKWKWKYRFFVVLVTQFSFLQICTILHCFDYFSVGGWLRGKCFDI